MTKGRFVLMWLGIALVLAGWGLGIAWGFGQPTPAKHAGPWQGIVIIVCGPLAVAMLWSLFDAYRALPSGRELRRRKLEQRAAELEADLARLEREVEG